MSKRDSIWALVVIVLALSAAWGQDSSAQQPAGGATETTPQQPVPAFGPDNPTPSINENPPISGLDLPNLEPHSAPLSYLKAGVHLNESVDSNIQNALGGSELNSVSRAMGSLELQRLWSHYDLYLDYLGGVGYYNVSGIGLKQIEELGLSQKVLWKRGQLEVRDAFSYQPEGSFGSAYGSVATTGAALGGQGAFFGGTALGALGDVPRIMNLTLVEGVENLTPKSAITVTGGYGFVHFLGNNPGVGNAFIGNSQVTGQVGYNRVLGPHDQGALTYGYQGFDFSTGVNFHSHVIQLMWGHRISGRMDFMIGAGPQFTQINNLLVAPTPSSTVPPCVGENILGVEIPLACPANDLRISAAGRVSLRYKFPRVSLSLSYQHYLTSGSGFFAGSESDVAMLNATRPLGRIWTAFSDMGYSRNSRVSSLTAAALAACTKTSTNPNPPTCPGTAGNVFQADFAGFGVRRMLGRTLQVFGSYQFNYLTFDSSFCPAASVGLPPGPCNRISQRHVGTIGLDWTPRPIRID
jgi:hypothetical protein